jgi:hypothetical protein
LNIRIAIPMRATSGGKSFSRHFTIELHIDSSPHLAHAALAELRDDAVASDEFSR